jgi:gamma-glutamyltranspeptidase/glutathione hydrolase
MIEFLVVYPGPAFFMRNIHYPGRSVVMSTHAMIATSQPMATAVGLDILRRGGNAMDAAVAACATLGVTEPASTGIGGDCFLLYHEARSGRLFGLNGSGRAPREATLEAFRRRGLDRVPERGILSVTVPGAVHAWAAALERFGTLSLGEALRPAIEYAGHGYAVTPVVARNWRQHEALLASHPDTRAALLVDGRAPGPGTLHRQPGLARSLRLIAEQGAEVFYRGELADRIVAFSRANRGLLSLEDFATHSSEWVEPLATDYRGVRVFELPPNGQGMTALMTLNILENAELGRLERLSAAHIHRVTEAFRLARAERDRFISDPAFNDIPVEGLLAKDFGRRQWARIDLRRALAHPLSAVFPDHRDTVYLTAVDRDRNVVSFINSLFHAFGSGLVAGDTGITLHARGCGFVLEDGHFNCIAPGKRPLHTIIPAMAYRDGRPLLSFGVMGGHFQAMGQSYLLSNWLDFGLDLQEAVDAPRFMPQGGVLTVERPIAAKVRRELECIGHEVVEAKEPLGGAQCIHIDADGAVLQAASDSRKDGCALGY